MSRHRENPLMDVPELKAISVKRLFELECKHIAEFKKGEVGYQEKMEGQKDFPWADCVECICAYIPFKVPFDGNSEGYIFRDVCFANWHDYVRACFAEYNKESVAFSVITKQGKKKKVALMRPNPIVERIKQVKL